MREIVIISGKGGAGKTTLAATLAHMLGQRAVIADCDVDAADMHLLLQPDETVSEPFFSGEEPAIDAGRCVGCGRCAEVCRFDALRMDNGLAVLDEFRCEGCGYCARICPAGAIAMQQRYVGELFHSTVRTGARMIHARLAPGGENSGKLVARVKKDARLESGNTTEYILVDGSPGIGCPVISSLSGADFVVLVTEPSMSALHDLERVLELLDKFRLPSGCVLNKADLNDTAANSLFSLLERRKIPLLGVIPYDERILEAVRTGVTPVEHAPEAFEPVYQRILDTIIKHTEEKP